MASECARSCGCLAGLDGGGKLHRSILLEPLSKLGDAGDLPWVNRIVEKGPTRDAYENGVSESWVVG